MSTNLLYVPVRRFGATASGRVLGRAAYRAAARYAARSLIQIPGVCAIYATGSLESEWLAPGYSDIDLALIVDLSGEGDEAALRAELRRRLDRLNRLAPLFRDVDYLALEDLPLLRSFPDGWGLHFEKRWTRLAGEDCAARVARATPAPGRDAQRLAQAFGATRRWLKASGYLLDPRVNRGAAIEVRGAQRLVADVLAAYLELDRQTPLPALFDAGRSALGARVDERCLALARTPPHKGTREDVLVLLSTSLDVLGALAARLVSEWTEVWEAPVVPLRPPAGARPILKAALGAGFVHAAAVSRFGDSGMVLVVPPPGSARDAVERFARWIEHCPLLPEEGYAWAPRPVLVSKELWQAAALFDPPPFIGWQLAVGACEAEGQAPTVVRRPTSSHFEALVHMMVVRQIRRARNRGFRMNKPANAVDRELELASAYDRVSGVDPSGAPGASGEPALLEAHYRWAASWRARLGDVSPHEPTVECNKAKSRP